MTDSRTLALARQQALEIHIAIATMTKPTDTWKLVDDLLETLTELPKYFQDPPPPPPPEPTELVLEKLTQRKKGTTIAKLSKLTELPQDTVHESVEILTKQGKVTRLKQRGVHAYTLTQNRTA